MPRLVDLQHAIPVVLEMEPGAIAPPRIRHVEMKRQPEPRIGSADDARAERVDPRLGEGELSIERVPPRARISEGIGGDIAKRVIPLNLDRVGRPIEERRVIRPGIWYFRHRGVRGGMGDRDRPHEEHCSRERSGRRL